MSEGSILVVSSEPGIARALQITLGAKGYEVNTGRVDEAVELSQSGRHDLVLLDNDRAPATVIEACREIRACSDVTIIVMSSDNSQEQQMGVILAGADTFIPKPFGIAEICASVQANMRKTRHADSIYQLN